MKTTTVTDAQIATLARSHHEIHRRITEGSLAVKPVLAGLQALIEGKFGGSTTEHVIDCDAPPFIPEGWSVKKEDQPKNAVHGQFTWNPTKVRRHFSKKQEGDKYIGGNLLRKELEDQPVLNANVLDHILKHPELIPEEWEDKHTFFWGTIYRNRGGNPYVRCLYWSGGRWCSCCHRLGSEWHDYYPAACAQASTCDP